MKTSELTGPALDWAVAKCEGHVLDCDEGADISGLSMKQWNYMPSENWSQGGPIIEREKIRVGWNHLWKCWISQDKRHAAASFMGPTPLIVAMRCYVASKLGEEVEIPEELR